MAILLKYRKIKELEKIDSYKNLTELLLNVVRKRPGMYLGNNHISNLPNFITGFMMSEYIYKNDDYYFGENGFLEWYCIKYKPEKTSFWIDYFLNETNSDEVKALELYFIRLEEYYEYLNRK